MRVLRIIGRLNIGGPAIYSILLTRHMQRLGYETLLVAGQVGAEEGDMAYLAEAQGVSRAMLKASQRGSAICSNIIKSKGREEEELLFSRSPGN